MTRRNHFVSLTILFLVTISLPATTIRRLSLEDVRDRAESIFIGHVASTSVRAVANGQLQATDYTIEVIETLYGSVPATTTVTFIGGPARPVEGAPRLDVDRDYVFFRTRQPNNTTVGWNQGLYRIETANVDGVDRKVLISGDGESLVMRNGALSRGRRVSLANGRIVPVVTPAHEVVQQAVEGVATNADGTPARRAPRVTKASAPALETFATLDDLRTFVRMRGTKAR